MRPDHLFLGTHADNVADMVRKGRQKGGRPVGLTATVKVCSCGRRFSAWTWSQLFLVAVRDGLEWRNCRSCHSTLVLPVPWVSNDPTDYQCGAMFDL